MTNSETATYLAGTTGTYAIVDQTRLTSTNTFTITYVLDCSTETSAELDLVEPIWLISYDTLAAAFTLESDGSLTTTRDAASIASIPEYIAILSPRTNSNCETNFPITYSDFSTSAVTPTEVDFITSSDQFQFNWD